VREHFGNSGLGDSYPAEGDQIGNGGHPRKEGGVKHRESRRPGSFPMMTR
jgi:hypothetical protein